MRRAVVLSGGGGKGSYQIGVWKALKKLHKKYQVVTGTSVGALNGAYMVQKDLKKAIETWENIDYGTIFDDALEIKTKKDALNFYVKGIVKDKGMKIENLETLVQKTIDEHKFRKSKIDYGLVTYNLSKMEPVCVKKEEIEKGKLCDYLIASSSCFPVFHKKKIESDQYIDGGYYDNVPFELALTFHVDEIIVVDLRAPGIKRKWNNPNVKLVWISPKNKLNSFLSFNSKEAKKNIRLGYNDTMKAFKKYDGDFFTFKKGTLHKNYKKNIDRFIDLIHETFHFQDQKKALLDKLLNVGFFYNFLNNRNSKVNEKIFNEIMEYLGINFHLDYINVYSIKAYHHELREAFNRYINEINQKESKSKLTFYSKDRIVLMYQILKIHQKTTKNKIELCMKSLLHPKDFLASIYLYMIETIQ